MKRAGTFRTASFTLSGLIFGALIAHPYIMLVYMLTTPGKGAREAFSLDIAKIVLGSFSAKMLPMAAAFSFFCASIGLLLGLLYENNQKVIKLRFEAERHKAVMASLQKTLAILSHFILNSTMVIGASVKQLRKVDKAPGLDVILERIERQAEKNERVLSLIKECNYLEQLEDTDTSLEKVLELTRLVEKRASEQAANPAKGKETPA